MYPTYQRHRRCQYHSALSIFLPASFLDTPASLSFLPKLTPPAPAGTLLALSHNLEIHLHVSSILHSVRVLLQYHWIFRQVYAVQMHAYPTPFCTTLPTWGPDDGAGIRNTTCALHGSLSGLD